MTSIQSVLASFAIILIDLMGRAGLDKVLALAGGPPMVALWAQLQSVVELVGAVTAAGVLQGLTVLITQVNDTRDEHSLLRDALKLGLGTSLAVALVVALASPEPGGLAHPGKDSNGSVPAGGIGRLQRDRPRHTQRILAGQTPAAAHAGAGTADQPGIAAGGGECMVRNVPARF